MVNFGADAEGGDSTTGDGKPQQHRDEMKAWTLQTFKWLWLLQGGDDGSPVERGDGSPEAKTGGAVPTNVGHLLRDPWAKLET